jgi:aminomethyltransferase
VTVIQTGIGWRSALHTVHQELGARWTQVAGWEVPASYDPKESLSAHRVPVLADQSWLTKIQVDGAELQAWAGQSGFVLPAPGQISKITEGKFSGCWAYRLADDRLWLVGEAGDREKLLKACAGTQGCVHPLDITSGLACLVLHGSQVPNVLAKLFSLDVPSLKAGQCTITGLQGYKVTLAVHAKTWRLFLGRDEARDVWGLILHNGHEHGITPIGAELLSQLENA